MDQKDYQRQWYQKNKERLRQKHKKYYEQNKESVLAQNKEYRDRTKEDRLAQNKEYYQNNREDRLTKMKERLARQKAMIGAVALHYKCQNPACQWKDFKACHLDFHHLDPSTKVAHVSQMRQLSLKKIAAEINKCVVLCRNCHCEHHESGLELNESMLCRVDDHLQIIS